MKYKVIGWDNYDTSEWKDGDASDAVVEAICDDIKKNGYEFSGYYHQEGWSGAPVLNDGLRYCFSQRGWGEVMAQAHGYTGFMDYAIYAFATGEEGKTPEGNIDESLIASRESLCETYSVKVSPEDFEKADSESALVIADDKKYRFLDQGDCLNIVVGDTTYSRKVTSVSRRRDLTDDEVYFLQSHNPYEDLEREKAKKIWDDAKTFLTIGIKKIEQ